MNSLTSVIVAGLSLLASGCAHFTMYTEPMNLKNKSYAMDMKQRIVLSHMVPTKDGPKTIICAEPSPDALTTISTSLGADFTSALTGSANRSTSRSNGTGQEDGSAATNGSQTIGGQIAAALSEQGSFVGIRTPALQTMRDSLYAVCQAYANQAVSESEYAAFNRRHQSTMLGLIAIEQMTRPISAQQVILTSNAAGQGGVPPAEAALQAQQARVKAAREANATAQGEVIKANQEIESINSHINDNIAEESKKRTEAKNAESDPAKKEDAANKAAEPIMAKRKEFEAQRNTKIAARRALELKVNATDQELQEAVIDLQRTQGRASASAGGSGQFGGFRDSASATSEVAQRVREVVAEVNQSYLRDHCFTLLSDLIKDFDKFKNMEVALVDKTSADRFNPVSVVRSALNVCNGILAAEPTRLLQTSTSTRLRPEELKGALENSQSIMRSGETPSK